MMKNIFKRVNNVNPNMIFKLLLKKSSTWKHNNQHHSAHIDASLPTYVWLEYFGNYQDNQPSTLVN